MPTHWTYEAFKPNEDLAQGDIIQPTEAVRAVLQDAHKHFLDPKYTAFIILTQSCDLARRDKQPCKSRYINLAVIRPLNDVLLSFLDTECDPVRLGKDVIEGMYVKESRFRADNLLSRILNQNEHGLGLFYLHADVDVGIADPSVAMIQVSITLRREHYEKLVAARSGHLTPEFQSRLGWIIGNLYSRVATQEWEPEKRKVAINAVLEACQKSGKGPFWLSQASVSAAKTKNLNIQGMPIDQIITEIQKHQPQPPMDVAIERILFIVKEIASMIDQPTLDSIRNQLTNDQRFESAFK